MARTFRLMLGQLNPTVGALQDNAAKARAAWLSARAAGCDMLALSEMFITGYQTQDLVLKPAFHTAAIETISQLAQECADGPALGIGGPSLHEGRLYNAYYILQNGGISAVIRKHHLPNSEVFDERRLFTPAEIDGPYSVAGLRIGTPICEDAWFSDVAETLAETGADILLVPNGSPYHRHKHDTRLNHVVARTVETGLPIAYLNMVGGQDDQVFDGASMVLNPGGGLAAQLPQFDECLREVTFAQGPQGWRAETGEITPLPCALEADYRAMVMGLGDYMAKSGFTKALIGLSGGIDSALVAAIGVDALGAQNLRCVMLPSRFTSPASRRDAQDCVQALGCQLNTIPIGALQEAAHTSLAPLIGEDAPGVTDENIQSRARGLLLMALSNAFGEMLLTTGNKSEMAVGYCTIYGDMNGGYNPVKDLYKTRLFEVARWRNTHHRPWMHGPAGALIAPNILTKPPSAELRADQTDQDSLPPYEELDAILEGLIEEDASVESLVERGLARPTIIRIQNLLFASEYKRFQSAPGTRLTRKALWLDRRYPIAHRWRDGQ